jgi:cell wall-associated NlpC family hydrolase
VHNRNRRGRGNLHHNGGMRYWRKVAITVWLGALALYVSQAQVGARASVRGLSADDRLAVIASALDAKTPRYAEHDCSHLVHAIYERAGFPYAYASSDDLYEGVAGFQRVAQPQSGDLVVWPGHAGIVIRPSRHVFFSFLHAGPGTDDYQSTYWSGRGQPRFYRYLKSRACAGCAVARGRTGQ